MPAPAPAPAFALPAVPEGQAAAPAPVVLAPAPAVATAAGSAMEHAMEGAMMREMISEMVQQLVATCPPTTAALLGRYLSNILSAPAEPKFRTIRQQNAKFAQCVGAYPAARSLLRLLGFHEVPDAAGALGEKLWVLPPTADLHKVHALVSLLPPVGAAPQPPQQPQQQQPQLSPLEPPPPPQPPQEPFRFPPTAAGAAGSSGGGGGGRPASAPNESRATITERKVEALRRQKEAPRPELRGEIARQLQLLHPSLAAAPQGVDDIPEEFYEVTEGDLRQLALSGGGGGGGGGAGKPGGGGEPGGGKIMTKAMRELDRLTHMKTYSHALVRVRLPGGLLMQATFHPLEPVSHVLDEVRALLRAENGARALPFHLFTTPPRVTLRPEQSLAQAGLVPAATATLAWDAPLPAHLAALEPSALIEHEAAADIRGVDAAQQSFPSAVGRDAKREAAAAAAAARLVGGGASSSSSSGGAASSSSGAEAGGGGGKKKAKPAWMKM